MSEIDELVEEARSVVRAILERVRGLLEADADIARVHGVTRKAVRHLEDVEAYALLAGSADREAETAITKLIVELRELLDDQAD
jgi:hypothetical protein